MADTIEKVYCTGDGGNDNLAAALLARGRDNDPATMLAAMNGGMGNWMNNPFAYMMMMAWMRDWNNRGGNLQDTELQNQIASLRTQMQDGNNTALLMDAVKGNNVALGQLAENLNCDMNQLQNAVCGVQAAIQNVGGKVGFSAERVINAANLGPQHHPAVEGLLLHHAAEHQSYGLREPVGAEGHHQRNAAEFRLHQYRCGACGKQSQQPYPVGRLRLEDLGQGEYSAHR